MSDVYMTLYGLVGKDIIKNDVKTEGLLGKQIKKTKWHITGAYPNHVTAERKGDKGFIEKQSFSIGDLVAMGVLKNERGKKYWEEENNIEEQDSMWGLR